jgi:peptide/nickel transport system substrate-binding protein
MKRKKLFVLFVSVVLVVSSLYGCSLAGRKMEQTSVSQNEDEKKGKTREEKKPVDAAAEAIAKFPQTMVNKNTAIQGGTLRVALVDDSAFAGVLDRAFYQDNYDSQIMQWFTENILSSDENFKFDQDGPATYEYDKAEKTVTLHMREGVKWHDGVKVTLDDLVFALEVICSKNYEGIRYGDSETNIVGVKEFHAGKADRISGLELSKDKMTLTIHFKDFYPSILVGGFWTSPLPRHYYKGIPVKDLASHEKVRKKPIGFGPFKVKRVVPGESVELERFDDYWLGKPKLDGVIITVIKPQLVPAAMKEGKFDIAEFSTQQYPDYRNPVNYQYIGELEAVFSYTGFKLGKWDAKNNVCIKNPNAKMADVRLRKAIGYAVDNATIGKTLHHGLRFLATTIITPRHAVYQDKEISGYTYDPKKSRQLLEEAGYTDRDGDGYRESPDGKPFTITWAVMDGEGADTIAQFKIQCWKDVGLRVELYNGRLTEFNAFYEAVEKDDPAIDMYDAAWGTGFDPNPASLWGHFSVANYTRYTSENFDSIIRDISSDKAWDSTFLSDRYKKWQEAFLEEAPAIPTLWRITLTAVNNRVKNYEVTSMDIKQTYHLIALTAEETVK